MSKLAQQQPNIEKDYVNGDIKVSVRKTGFDMWDVDVYDGNEYITGDVLYSTKEVMDMVRQYVPEAGLDKAAQELDEVFTDNPSQMTFTKWQGEDVIEVSGITSIEMDGVRLAKNASIVYCEECHQMYDSDYEEVCPICELGLEDREAKTAGVGEYAYDDISGLWTKYYGDLFATIWFEGELENSGKWYGSLKDTADVLVQSFDGYDSDEDLIAAIEAVIDSKIAKVAFFEEYEVGSKIQDLYRDNPAKRDEIFNYFLDLGYFEESVKDQMEEASLEELKDALQKFSNKIAERYHGFGVGDTVEIGSIGTYGGGVITDIDEDAVEDESEPSFEVTYGPNDEVEWFFSDDMRQASKIAAGLERGDETSYVDKNGTTIHVGDRLTNEYGDILDVLDSDRTDGLYCNSPGTYAEWIEWMPWTQQQYEITRAYSEASKKTAKPSINNLNNALMQYGLSATETTKGYMIDGVDFKVDDEDSVSDVIDRVLMRLGSKEAKATKYNVGDYVYLSKKGAETFFMHVEDRKNDGMEIISTDGDHYIVNYAGQEGYLDDSMIQHSLSILASKVASYTAQPSGEHKQGNDGNYYGYYYVQHDSLGNFWVSYNVSTGALKSDNYPWEDLGELTLEQKQFIDSEIGNTKKFAQLSDDEQFDVAINEGEQEKEASGDWEEWQGDDGKFWARLKERPSVENWSWDKWELETWKSENTLEHWASKKAQLDMDFGNEDLYGGPDLNPDDELMREGKKKIASGFEIGQSYKRAYGTTAFDVIKINDDNIEIRYYHGMGQTTLVDREEFEEDLNRGQLVKFSNKARVAGGFSIGDRFRDSNTGKDYEITSIDSSFIGANPVSSIDAYYEGETQDSIAIPKSIFIDDISDGVLMKLAIYNEDCLEDEYDDDAEEEFYQYADADRNASAHHGGVGKIATRHFSPKEKKALEDEGIGNLARNSDKLSAFGLLEGLGL